MRGPPVFLIVCTLLLTLYVASSAPAELALFRVEQRWHNAPNPPVTTPGGAGMYQAYIQPYLTQTALGEYIHPPGIAIVEPGNPIGGAFTLPMGFINFSGTYSITPNIGWPGYSTITYVSYYNGPGKFGSNNLYGATAPTRVVFPTTMGNPTPNYGLGNPVTPTTTFDGRYDMSRGGSIHVTPGPRRFGGTFRLFYGPNAGFYVYIFYFIPAVYKAYGHYFCFDEGMFDCTKDTFVSKISDTTAIYKVTSFLLNVTGTGTGKQTNANTAKATAPIGYGGYPTQYGNASYITGMQVFLNLIHPWTTGFASVVNVNGSPDVITPQAQGYDTSLGGADITVVHYDRNQNWNTTLGTVTTYTTTAPQKLYGVGRVVSMVRPRLIHSYKVPLDPSTDPITNLWQAARLWRLKVFFLPEPAGMLLLAAGLGCLMVLHRLSRRD